MPNSLNSFLDLFRKKSSRKLITKNPIKNRIRLIPKFSELKLNLEKAFHDDRGVYVILSNKNFFDIDDHGDYLINYENLKNNFLINLHESSLDTDLCECLGINLSDYSSASDNEGEGSLNLNMALDEDRKLLDYFPTLIFNKQFKVTVEINGNEAILRVSMRNENNYENITDKIKENGLILDFNPKAKKQSLTVLPYWIYQLFYSYFNQREFWTSNNPVLIASLQKLQNWVTEKDNENQLILDDLRLTDLKVLYFSKFDLYATKSLDASAHEDLASLIPLNDDLEEYLAYQEREEGLKAIQRGLKNWDNNSNTIKVKTADGSTVDLGLNPNTKKAILKLKTDYHHKPSNQIINNLKYHSESSIIKESPEFYNIFNLDISEYGLRVIGIGKPIVIPGQFGKVQQKAIFDGIDKLEEPDRGDDVSLESDGFVKIHLGKSNQDEDQYINLSENEIPYIKEKLDLAQRENQQSLNLKDSKTNKEIELDITRSESFHYFNSCLDRAKKIFRNNLKPESKSEQVSKEENDKAIIIQTNAENREYDETLKCENLNSDLDWSLVDIKEDIDIFPYQKECIQWLVNCFMAAYPGVLLADDMGLGKTFQTMCFMKILMRSLWQRRFPEIEFKPVLIVVPPILLDNFEKQAKDFFIDSEEFAFTILHGSRVRDYFCDVNAKVIPEAKLGYPLLDSKLLLKHKCLIMTYDTMVNYEHSLAKIPWSLLLCDEVQKAKSAKTQVSRVLKAIATKATFKILMSGTPVENDMSELWNIMDSTHAGLLGALKDFRKGYKAFFNSDSVYTEREECFQRLKQTLKFGDFNEGYANGRLKSEIRKDLPDLISETVSFKLEEEVEGQINSVLKSKYPALKKVSLIKQSSVHKFLANGKIYTRPYFKEWFETNYRLAKFKDILERIKNTREKALVFCEYNDYQEAVQDFINETYSLSLSPINSNLSEENKKANLNKFQTQIGFSALVLSPRCAGMGLNLQEANHVLHLTRWWNPAVEDQATCRAYRTGQKKNVYVYYFVADHVFEKNLHERLELKRNTRKNLFDLSYMQNVSEVDILEKMSKELVPDSEITVPTLNEIDFIKSDNKAEQGKKFENIIKDIFEKQGYIVTKPSKDRGVDFIFTNESAEQFAVQVKHVYGGKDYADRKTLLAFPQVIKTYSAEYNLEGGMFITNGTYKDSHRAEMQRMSDEHDIQWIDRSELDSRLKSINFSH